MTTYLGWDCAYKSLAHILITIDTNVINTIRSQLRIIIRDFLHDHDETHLLAQINDMNKLFCTFIVIKSHGVVDLLNGKNIKDVDEVTRTKLLRQYVDQSEVAAGKLAHDTKIKIEYQPPKLGKFATNTVSTTVSHQLAMYYSDFDIEFINSRIKNNITFTGPTFSDLVADLKPKYKNFKNCQYTARKLHSKTNFRYLVEVFGREDIINETKKEFLDDIADAFMQLVQYVNIN